MKRPVLCLILVVVGLSTLIWAGTPEGAAPAAPTAATAASPDPNPAPAPPVINSATASPVVDSLLNLMVSKGVITSSEASSLRSLPPGQQVTPLLTLLAKKGVLSQEELASLQPAAAPAYGNSSVEPVSYGQASPAQNVAASTPPKPPAPSVVAAVAPLRVLPVDVPKREGLIPDLKVGPVRLKPYGFIKMSTVYDSSQPRGDDFPLPGFVFGDTGPNASPEFHVKARSTRLGSNFEWLDPSPRLTVTGKVEIDFEGNFTAVDNRNISSIRSSQPSIRLAFGRLDYAASDSTTVYGVFGQDWTPFGSSTLPNTLETTGLGLGFGSLYERAPQVRGGFVHNFGGSRSFKLLAETAAVLPAFGNTPSSSNFQIPGTSLGSNTFPVIAPDGTVIGTTTIPQTTNSGLGLLNQLNFGERQGADSARPEVQARVVGQFQLDRAPGVAPAQLIVSGVQGERTATVLKANVPSSPAGSGLPANFYKDAFPNGAQVSSDRYGISLEAQLPTRWFTVLAKYYRGADLRYFFAGQLYSFYNNTAAEGLKNTATAPSIDGSAAVVFGNLNGTPTVASQNPIRSAGGFLELGLPLSRWANANPKGHNAGWTMNLHYGLDDANGNDIRKLTPGGQRDRSDWAFANLLYKLNTWVTLGYEESLYTTKAFPNVDTGLYTGTLFRGNPSREWRDLRSEFSTIFTF
ncbi:MAG TPA: hypothetical protein VG897_04730 [Terriglobales bacterium]|nr:hypothetical protein [Terriglobales bacterium]